MTVEENVKKDAIYLDRISSNLSISKARKVVYDFSFLSMLVKVLKVDDLDIDVDFVSLDDGENIVYAVEDNLEALENLANRVLKMYKNIEFYCYFDGGYASLSHKDKVEILYDFLDGFLPELLTMYKKLYESNHIFVEDLGTALGQSYIMQNINSYYIALSVNQENDITNLETIIHELLHVYSAHFLRNYDWKKTQSLLNGLSGESVPLYGELAFFDYLIRNNIVKDSTYFHRNLLDYNLLEFFKIIKFFCHFARKNKADFVFRDGFTYEYVGGKFTYPLYDGVPFMEFNPDDLKKSELVNFAYGIGGLEAYNLYRLEKRGVSPKEIINDFLLRQGTPDHVEKDIINADLSFMASEIKKHQLVLEGIRPITGYHK